MLYDVKTPEEYLNALEPDWRKEKLEELRKLIKKAGPELTEGIGYKMLSYGVKDQTVFHLAISLPKIAQNGWIEPHEPRDDAYPHS